MRYNAFPAPLVGSFKAFDAPGTGHVSQGMNTLFCVRCCSNQPSAGGHFRQKLFICAKHPKASVPA